MKGNIALFASLLAVVVSVTSMLGFFEPEDDGLSAKCEKELRVCTRSCDATYHRSSREVLIDSINEELFHRDKMLECRLSLTLDDAAKQLCVDQETTRHASASVAIEQRKQTVETAYEVCLADCDELAEECQRAEGPEPFVKVEPTPVDIDCVVNDPCMVPVEEICTVISNPCENCFRSLCPGSNWSFSADGLLGVSLVAATNPTQTGRVLVKANAEDYLSVPNGIRLDTDEKLYIQVEFEDEAEKKTINILRNP